MEDFKCLNAQQAQDLIAKEAHTIIDIRDPHSFSQGHIPQAVSVNDDNIATFLQETNKDKPLICYCYHGISSQNAAMYFVTKGFKTVYSVDGGYEEWKKCYE